MLINRSPRQRDLTLFGALLPVVFGVLGYLLGRRIGSVVVMQTLWVTGMALTIAYFVVPTIQRRVFVGWAYATYPIAWTISHAILVAVFFVVITPIALLVRVFTQDPLARKFDRGARSYWIAREHSRGAERYFRQF
jgi:hypothetical protein